MTKPLKNPRLIKIQSQANIVTQTCQTLCGWSLGDKWRHSGGPMWVLFAGLRSFCELAHSVELPISLPMTLTPCVYCEMCLIKPPSQSEAGFSPPSTCLISLPQTGTLKRFTWQNIISVPQNAAHLWHTSPFTTWWTECLENSNNPSSGNWKMSHLLGEEGNSSSMFNWFLSCFTNGSAK